ncbi:MAG: DinB family protein [Acidobacteria bacterium]|nr:MAG: DinB family protein [Acidobacteriota bacterium]
MGTTVESRLNEIEVFRTNAHLVNVVLQRNLEGISHEESLAQPCPGGNCLNWVLGHLLHVYNNALPLLHQEPVMEKKVLERYARGAAPLSDPAEAVPWNSLTKSWNEAARRVDEGLGRLSPELLDSPAPFSPTDNPEETVRSLLTTLFFHQAYHAGQTGILRRLAGKKGAIA